MSIQKWLNEFFINTLKSGNYPKNLDNKSITGLLLSEQNISVLENFLYTESQNLKIIQKLKDNSLPDKEKALGYKGLESLLDEIKEEVDTFLGVTNVIKPEIRYKSFSDVIHAVFSDDPETLINNPTYNPKTSTLSMVKKTIVKLVPDTTHEYTHHVQNVKWPKIPYEKYSALLEGHATGVERHVAKMYSEKANNKLFLHSALDTTVGELKSAYEWMCDSLGVKCEKILLSVNTSRDEREALHRSYFKKPSFHALGNTLFCIIETKKGNRIYNELLKEKFDSIICSNSKPHSAPHKYLKIIK